MFSRRDGGPMSFFTDSDVPRRGRDGALGFPWSRRRGERTEAPQSVFAKESWNLEIRSADEIKNSSDEQGSAPGMNIKR